MIALVGQTSRQLACSQCLHTSLIMCQATGLLGDASVRSMNFTCRQFCASSCPVLSKLSRNCGALPGSWFHSLHATSHALQPMHRVVSVKKPGLVTIYIPIRFGVILVNPWSRAYRSRGVAASSST